ncbi:MAG: ABC transporter ATP-binding protein [bacterium]|nr:ABC transporter ATP-binding protein [bacterium]
MNNVIEIKDLTVSYRENVALKSISLDIKKGTFISVIGPNGAGKTTLLTAINGLGKILSGTVKIFGRAITPYNVSYIRKKIGYMPQKLAIDPRFPISVEDTIKIGRFGRVGIFRKLSYRDKEIVQSAMKVAGIENLAKRPIGHLSGGEGQKVALARVLAQEPEIMLLDEPTANLDPKSQSEIINVLDKIYEKQKITIIFVTHILSHIPSSCKEAVLMKKGSIIWNGEVGMINKELLSNLYDYPVTNVVDAGQEIRIYP